MPCRDVHIDDAHRGITEHVALEGFALDDDATNGTHRPENWRMLLPLASADLTSGVHDDEPSTPLTWHSPPLVNSGIAEESLRVTG